MATSLFTNILRELETFALKAEGIECANKIYDDDEENNLGSIDLVLDMFTLLAHVRRCGFLERSLGCLIHVKCATPTT